MVYYNYYIKPHLEYCCTIWGQCSKTDTYSIVKLQKQAARLILDADMYSPSTPVFKQLQWQTFDKIVKEKQASMVFKALNNLTPAYITNLFKPECTYTNHSLRSKTSNKLHLPAAHHKSLRFIGPKIWNSLSDKARKATTLNEYMRELKKWKYKVDRFYYRFVFCACNCALVVLTNVNNVYMYVHNSHIYHVCM